MDIVGKKHIFFTISGVLVALSVLAMALFGFRLGIDFEGGTVWRFAAGGEETQEKLLAVFANELGVSEPNLSFDPEAGAFTARLPALDEAKHREYAQALSAAAPQFTELEFQSLGPAVGKELTRKALYAIVLVLLGISLYIAFAFRKASYPVRSWKYGVITLLTLFHDVVIPAGLLSLLGRTQGVEIDTNFIVALLVVMGFSVHDTIVVFDRIRENVSKERGRTAFGEVVNRSVRQTLVRSVNTSATLILVLVALLAVGPSTLRYFLLTLLVGVTAGTYSSIFVASPALLLASPASRQ
jgi:preprotein translocase subunit SecF